MTKLKKKNRITSYNSKSYIRSRLAAVGSLCRLLTFYAVLNIINRMMQNI